MILNAKSLKNEDYKSYLNKGVFFPADVAALTNLQQPLWGCGGANPRQWKRSISHAAPFMGRCSMGRVSVPGRRDAKSEAGQRRCQLNQSQQSLRKNAPAGRQPWNQMRSREKHRYAEESVQWLALFCSSDCWERPQSPTPRPPLAARPIGTHRRSQRSIASTHTGDPSAHKSSFLMKTRQILCPLPNWTVKFSFN